MNTATNLTELVEVVSAYHGSWKDAPLAQDVKMFLWQKYDANDDLIYPTTKMWAELLKKTVAGNSFDALDKDEVLSIIFGLIHHTRIVDGSWELMFHDGVTQKLLERLLQLDSDKFR